VVGRLKRLAQGVGSRFGVTGYNLYLLRMLKRPEWIYRAHGRIPYSKFTFLPPAQTTPADLALCARLIGAYRKAAKDHSVSKDQSAIWSQNFSRYGQKLLEALRQDDPAPLAAILGTMFREPFLHGIATGDLYSDARSWLGSRIWSLKCLDDLVSLAESLGVVRTECPEQGVVGYSLRDGLEPLIAKIEAALGMPIGFPDVGAPYGLKVGQTLITMESPEHLYVACRVSEAMRLFFDPRAKTAPKIVEIGGGFGGTAYWLLRLRSVKVSSYTVIDLPLTNVLEGYFLSKTLGESMVALYGEGPEENTAPKPVRVLPTGEIHSLQEAPTDVLVNQNSMPEMPEPAVREYIEWAGRNLRGIFYSYNQEGYSPVAGVPQVLVPEIIARAGGFERLSRGHSWLRRGYVEEVYACRNRSAKVTNPN